MAKVFTFFTIILGIFAMFAIFGVGDSNTSQLLRTISFDNPEDLKAFDLFSLIFSNTSGVIATISAAGAIIVGLFTRQSTESILLAGFASVLAGWIVGDMYTIIANSEAMYSSTFPFFSKIVKTYFVVFIGGFIISIIEWWRGTD